MKKNTIARIGFTLPFLLPLVIFWIIPLFMSFFISFTDWDYISSDFNMVGLTNYIDLMKDSDFLKALKNTFYFALGTILPTLVLGFVLALFFQKEFVGNKIFRTIIFSPWITPAVAVSMVWSWIYNPDSGFANYILNHLGLASSQWLQSRETAMLAIIIFTIWKSVGWTFLFYIGALSQVSKSIYEAADIDGTTYMSKLFHITLPLISPTTFFLFVVNLIQSIQVYDQINIMTHGGPGGSTTTLLYLYYDKSFQNFQMGPANAVAMVILILIILLSVCSNIISSRYVHYE